VNDRRKLPSVRFAALTALIALFATPARSQPPSQFEVAVIRPATADPKAGTAFNVFEGGRLKITNEPIKLLIRAAFQLQNAQIAGYPEWVETDRFDIEAKTGKPGKINPDEMAPLLQALLAERFGFKFHRETRELSVSALVVDKGHKGASNLKPAVEQEKAGMNTHGGPKDSQLVATSTTMNALANYVGNRLGRLVVDSTALTGVYDFTLEWSPEESADSPAPSLTTALHDQLGLRLASQKSPVDVLVIDSIQRPSDN
jgi:uncharacterized protein (TIGR03435 family)